MDRILVIQKSIQAYTSGIIGIIPVIGLGPAIYAVICWVKIRREYREWNPAKKYLNRGALLGAFGILVSVALILIIGIAIIDSYC